MAWITSDTDVATVLTVSKEINGQPLDSYPKTYSMLEPFGAYPAITVDEWHKAQSPQRDARIAGFIQYVNNVEGISVRGTQLNTEFRLSPETQGQIVE